jgi:hypothetical protein
LGDSYNYTWNFGDNTASTTAHTAVVGNSPTHLYSLFGNYVINLILTDAFGLSSTASTTVNVTALNIVSVASTTDINVANGTASSSIGLPTTVTVTLSDGSTSTVAVTWNNGTPAYNGNITDTYTFTGTLSTSNGITNPSHLTASVNVNVAFPSGGGGGGGSSYRVGDINHDGHVDEYDFAIMMSEWGEIGNSLTADLNNDKIVDEYDFAILMANWD